MSLRLAKSEASPYWQITGTVAGQRVRETTGTADKRLAEEIKAKREAEIIRADLYGKQAFTVTWDKACLSYLEVVRPNAKTQGFLLKLTKLFANRKLSQIDQEALDEAVKALCKPDAAPATWLRNVITPARAVLTHAARRGWCELPKIETPPDAQGNKRTRWLTPEEFTRLHEHCPPHIKPLVLFLVCTGARVEDAVMLDWTDVDLIHHRTLLRDTKNGNDRLVDLYPALLSSLKALEPRKGRVFLTHKGQPYPSSELNGGQIKTAWATAAKNAGFAGEEKITPKGYKRWVPDDVTPHVLRHTWASWRYAFHKDLLRLKTEGDWSSVTLCERYAKLTPEGMLPEILKVWGLKKLAKN